MELMPLQTADFSSVTRLFFPFNQGRNHWVLYDVDTLKEEIVCYDSLRTGGPLPAAGAQVALPATSSIFVPDTLPRPSSPSLRMSFPQAGTRTLNGG